MVRAGLNDKKRLVAQAGREAPDDGLARFEIYLNEKTGQYELWGQRRGRDTAERLKQFLGISAALSEAKKTYNLGIRHWKFDTSLNDLLAADEIREAKQCEEDKRKRGMYALEGVGVVLFFTLLAFVCGVGLSFKDHNGLEFWQHLQNGWVWIRNVLILSIIVFGIDSYFSLFFFGFDTPRKRWQSVGGIASLFVLSVAVWLSSDMDEIKAHKNKKAPGLSIHIEWTKKP